MAYEKLELMSGDVLDAEVFAKIDRNFDKAPVVPAITANDFGKQLFVNKDGTGFMLLGNTHEEKWNFCDLAESLKNGTWEIGNRTPSTGTGQFDTYYYMPVKPNSTYYLGESNGASPAYYARCVNWYDKDKNFLSLKEYAGSSITSPANAWFCTVSFYKSSPSYFFTDIEDEENRVNKVINDSIQINQNKWNLLELASSFKDNYYVNGSTTSSGPAFYTYFDIPVKPKTQYYYSCNGFVAGYNLEYGARFINWYDAEKNFISVLNGPRGAVQSPSGAAFCTITFLSSGNYQTYTTKEDVEMFDEPFFTAEADPSLRVNGEETYTILTSGVSTDTLTKINEAWDMAYAASESVREVEHLKNAKMFNGSNFINTTRKGIVNFQFDDAPLAGDTAVKLVFDKYGYKCDFAITTSVATSSSCADYLQFEREGFGILSHSTDGAGYGSVAEETVIVQTAKMKTSHDVLTNAGFNIHGWVTPSSGMNKIYYDACAEIYDYGFGISSLYNPNLKIHYFGTTTHLAQIPRVGIESSINNKVDSTTGDLKSDIKTYLSNFWGITPTTDIENKLATISNIPFETIVTKAIEHKYEAAVENNALNEAAITYLNDVWGVSVDSGNLILGETTATIIPTFKKASYRKGMVDIKNLINTAYTTKGLLVLYSHNAGYIATNEHGWGEAALVEILDYCKEIGIAVMNAADAIYDMYSFRYTDFLELKNS